MSLFAIGCILAFTVYLHVAGYVLWCTPRKLVDRLTLGVPVIAMFVLALPGLDLCPAVLLSARVANP